VARIGELETILAVASNRRTLQRNTMMEALRSYETSVLTRNSFFSITSRPALGSTGTSYKMITAVLCPGAEQPWHQADHSPPIRAEMNNGGIIPEIPHISP
jgi:hypothetical protein